MNGRNDDNENHKRHLQGRVMTKWNECVSVSEDIALFMTILLRDDIFLCVFFHIIMSARIRLVLLHAIFKSVYHQIG